MQYLLAFVVIWILYTLLSWSLQLLASRRQTDFRLSFDERHAQNRAEALLREFGGNGLPTMTRSEIWRRIVWIWKSARLITLRSGRWSAVPWLAVFALLGLGLGLKTVLFPNSSDLRLLLGGRDFLSFLVADRRKTPSR